MPGHGVGAPMEPLREHILLLCNADRAGGRAQILDEETIALYDCMDWSHALTDALTLLYPDLQLSVKASRQSLSGFVVHFRRPRWYSHLGWYAAIGVLLACCCYMLWSPPRMSVQTRTPRI